MEKYYTPEIEELRVGFECEVQNHADAQKRFFPATIDGKGLSIILKIDPKTIRAKYLDKQDIEEYDWKFIEDSSVGDGNFRWYDLFEYKDYTLAHWGYMGEDFDSADPYNYKVIIQKSGKIIFEGLIKNKSELKQIMKMVKIL